MNSALEEIMTPEIEAALIEWYEYSEDMPLSYIEWLNQIKDYLVWLWATQDIGENEDDAKKLQTFIHDIIVICQGLSKLVPANLKKQNR